jgi:hypothetical protein
MRVSRHHMSPIVASLEHGGACNVKPPAAGPTDDGPRRPTVPDGSELAWQQQEKKTRTKPRQERVRGDGLTAIRKGPSVRPPARSALRIRKRKPTMPLGRGGICSRESHPRTPSFVCRQPQSPLIGCRAPSRTPTNDWMLPGAPKHERATRNSQRAGAPRVRPGAP